MAAGKLLLLVCAAGTAGMAFAGMTAGAMRSYHGQVAHEGDEYLATSPQASRPAYEPTRPAYRSWLDEGISLLDSPAWPFGPRTSTEMGGRTQIDRDMPGYRTIPDDSEDDDAGPDRGGIDRNPHADQSRTYAPPGLPFQAGAQRIVGAEAQADPRQPWDDGAQEHRPSQDAMDLAADAAGRAADAAQDVIAAERHP